MAQSTDARHFFQTSAALEESTRKETKAKNTNGDPVRLDSKLLALHADPAETRHVYVAASSAVVKRVNLETGTVDATYTGPSAPVTSIAFSAGGGLLFAGCWDKLIWCWDVASKKVLHKLAGHADFVKSVRCTVTRTADGSRRELLVSSGSDAQVMVWDVSDAAAMRRTDVIKGLHAKGVHDLAIDPETVLADDGAASSVTATATATAYPTLFTAGSDRVIQHLELRPDAGSALALRPPSPIVAHETSVFKLFFDADGDLWTASADKTAKCLSRQRDWATELTLEHPDFVRDVVVHEQGGWVVTACRDEEVRVWDRATGVLYHTYSGHFEEVTGLLIIGNLVVSISIDGTVRKWPLDRASLNKAREEAAKPVPETADTEEKQENALTAEEEAELAELMDDLDN
ncbi:hypothetical protein KEM52_001106 [Ascosphaera acerosa]|nr:hypothetical protein KEM52_001106 [Ascosphaera acerosa]